MSSTPYIPTPSWLDPLSEIKEPDQPKQFQALSDENKAIVFILNSLRGLLISCSYISLTQAIEVIANSVGETGWGRYHRGRNFGGWKISKADVDRAKAAGKKCPPWWKALGHVKSGDQPFVYYRGFSSVDRFYSEWLERFVPRHSSPSHRYHNAGKAFWSIPQGDWFRELINGGYKGEVTKANPEGSIENHKEIANSVKTRIAQFFLGVKPDGIWGPASKKRCEEYQREKGLTVNGLVTQETLVLLVEAWKRGGMPVSVLL